MTHRRTERQKKSSPGLHGTNKGHEDWAGRAVEVQSGVRLELAGELLSRAEVGKDGRTAFFRLCGRNSAKAVLQIGEQVMAKPFEWSQMPQEVVFQGTLGVRDAGWY